MSSIGTFFPFPVANPAAVTLDPEFTFLADPHVPAKVFYISDSHIHLRAQQSNAAEYIGIQDSLR
jgi:hypothetical protein